MSPERQKNFPWRVIVLGEEEEPRAFCKNRSQASVICYNLLGEGIAARVIRVRTKREDRIVNLRKWNPIQFREVPT